MDDDFNTPRAIAVLHDIAGEINRHDKKSDKAKSLAATLKALGGVLGLLQDSPVAYLQRGTGGTDGLDSDAIEKLVAERNQARKDRNFQQADRIRDLLKEQGIELEDTPDGTLWRRD